jgi:DNA-binding response OmpR family regulator
MNIAVLEDHPDIAEMLQHGLGLAGYSVVVNSRPAPFFAALLAPASAPVDCLIVNLQFSEGISGGEVIEHVRKTFPALPVILIFESSSWEIDAARRDLPGIEVLRKPFKLATLLSMVKKLAN